jgi:hypothetical protein
LYWFWQATTFWSVQADAAALSQAGAALRCCAQATLVPQTAIVNIATNPATALRMDSPLGGPQLKARRDARVKGCPAPCSWFMPT